MEPTRATAMNRSATTATTGMPTSEVPVTSPRVEASKAKNNDKDMDPMTRPLLSIRAKHRLKTITVTARPTYSQSRPVEYQKSPRAVPPKPHEPQEQRPIGEDPQHSNRCSLRYQPLRNVQPIPHLNHNGSLRRSLKCSVVLADGSRSPLSVLAQLQPCLASRIIRRSIEGSPTAALDLAKLCGSLHDAQ
ncbi:subtilisin family serine protease [Arthrobacter sp. CAN_A212]